MRSISRWTLGMMVAGLAAWGVASATGKDGRGWHAGTPAKGAARVLGAPEGLPATVSFPADFAAQLDKTVPTLVVYFSPTCPHCRNVAAELQSLASRHRDSTRVIGVASGSSQQADIDEFTETYGISFPIVVDTRREIASAMGARSTPAAMLVTRSGKKVRPVDTWYPYGPGYDALVELRLAKSPWDVFEPGVYQGARQCAACHIEETESWLLSHHSVAWRTLTSREKHQDPECVNCHVTGAEQPHGWTPGDDGRLVDVGCESCHGPGGPHDGTATDPSTTCEGCHDAKHSIAFSYPKGLPLIDHYRANAMSDEAFREARKELSEGEASRGLLAFAESTYVGSEACGSCHADALAWWTSSPHGQAMARLEAQGSHEDPRCVRCHATPLGGFAGDDPAKFRTTEGVGCESCHGPGGNHVAAGGGTDNIEGLGESCPVCVIEAVCTSCHTSAWHPGWDLDVHLPKVEHMVPKTEDSPNE